MAEFAEEMARFRSLPAKPDSPQILPLSGRRVFLDLSLDSSGSLVPALLRDALRDRDAVPCDSSADADLVISGAVSSHGYAEVYLAAQLSLESRGEKLASFTRRLDQGDRVQNLVKELVELAELSFAQSLTRHERTEALRELGR